MAGMISAIRQRIQAGTRKSFNAPENDEWHWRNLGPARRQYWIPGTNLDWEALAGDLWMIPGVQAVLNWKWRNFIQVRPKIMRETDGDQMEPMPDHPLLQVLRKPNPGYDGTLLQMMMLFSLEFDG